MTINFDDDLMILTVRMLQEEGSGGEGATGAGMAAVKGGEVAFLII